jgi:nucleoredoxin
MNIRTSVRVAVVVVAIGAALLLAAEPPVCPVTPPASQPAAASQPGQSPWAAMFSDGLTDAQGKSVSLDSLQGKVVGVYFSAHWCPPCRAFTPLLVKYRDAHQADFEVVLVDLDHSAKEMQEYMTGQNMK